MHFSVSTYAELFAFFVSLILYRKLSGSLRPFSFLLFLVVVVEVGSEFKLTTWHKSNNWIYNLLTLIEFLFFSFFYYHQFAQSKFRRLLPFLAFLLAILTGLNILFFQGFWHFNSYTFILGSLLMISCSLHYFFQGIRKSAGYDFLNDPVFWVSVGLLIFYAGEFTLMMTYSLLAPLKLREYSRFFRLLMDVLNIVEYGLISFAFWQDARFGNFRRTNPSIAVK